MNARKLQYPDYTVNQDENMSDGRTRIVLPVSLSEMQIEAVEAAAQKLSMNRSEFMRWALSQVIEDFPDDLPAQGKKKTPKIRG